MRKGRFELGMFFGFMIGFATAMMVVSSGHTVITKKFYKHGQTDYAKGIIKYKLDVVKTVTTKWVEV